MAQKEKKRKMKIPKKCPHCGAKWFGDEPFRSYLFVRTDLDFDSDGDAGRIEDQIYECSECHTLFRARWELVSFVELVCQREVLSTEERAFIHTALCFYADKQIKNLNEESKDVVRRLIPRFRRTPLEALKEANKRNKTV